MQPEWLHVPFQGTEKTRVERLHDLALELPDLLERTDTIAALSLVGELDEDIKTLVAEYVDLKNRLLLWLEDFEAEEGGQIYWLPISDAEREQPSPEPDPICVPSFPDQSFVLRFPSGPKAGLLCHYWSFQLQLLMELSELERRRFLPSDGGALRDKSSKSDSVLIETEAYELAQLILQAEPYLSSCLEGRITVQAPLEIVNRYLHRPQSDADNHNLSTHTSAHQASTV